MLLEIDGKTRSSALMLFKGVMWNFRDAETRETACLIWKFNELKV
jgi:hypothetical protein